MYDKPKVTIDLDEYQELKNKVSLLENEDNFVLAKKVIACMMRNQHNPNKIDTELRQEGISFTYYDIYNNFSLNVNYEHIKISKIKTK